MIKLHNSEKVKRVLENHFSQKIRKTFGNITKKLNILNRPVLAKDDLQTPLSLIQSNPKNWNTFSHHFFLNFC